MKIKVATVLTPGASKLAFGFACALIAATGWTARTSLEQLDSIADEGAAIFNCPAPAYYRFQRQMTNWGELKPPVTPSMPFSPTNNEAPVLQLP
jgi:hypothetical protein